MGFAQLIAQAEAQFAKMATPNLARQAVALQNLPSAKRQASPTRYLPKSVKGKIVLKSDGGNFFVVDNTKLQAGTPGLQYRLSKNFEDRATEFAKWGTTI